MKILKKGGVVEEREEKETKSMPHAPVEYVCTVYCLKLYLLYLINMKPARASENYLAISSKVSRFFGPRYIGDDFF